MAEDTWYYEKNGEQHGPVSQSELEELIEQGELTRDSMVWKPGERDWSETGTFEMLIPAFKTPPPLHNAPPAEEPPPLPAREAVPPPPPPAQAPPPPPEPQIHFNAHFQLPSQGPEAQEPPQKILIPAIPPEPEILQVTPVSEAPKRRESKDLDGPKRGRSGKRDWHSWIGHLMALLQMAHRQHTTMLWVSTAVAVTVSSTVVYYSVRPTPIPEPKPKPVATATSLVGIRAPVGYTGPVGQIKIDAYPWARLTRLTRVGEGEVQVPGTQITPLVVLVAPGTYEVELGDQSCTVQVAVEQTRTCSKVVRTIDAAAYYREVGW